MKKMLICCGALCMTLLLFCGTAFAAVKVDKTDASVEVTANDAGTEVKVVKNDVKAEDNYLVMIQKGAATDKPTEKNLYYLDVTKPDGTKFEKTAYPKTMEEGTYVVFLSDWSTAGNGARKAVATLTVGGDNPNPDPVNNNDYQCGDVNHSGGNPDNIDLIILARYVGEWPAYMTEGALDLSLGDVNASGGNPDNIDLLILARYVGEWPGYTSLPRK